MIYYLPPMVLGIMILLRTAEAIYRILARVCLKNYTTLTHFSVHSMVILKLHTYTPCSKHKLNLVRSGSQSLIKSEAVDAYGCTYGYETEGVQLRDATAQLGKWSSSPVYPLFSWMWSNGENHVTLTAC